MILTVKQAQLFLKEKYNFEIEYNTLYEKFKKANLLLKAPNGARGNKTHITDSILEEFYNCMISPLRFNYVVYDLHTTYNKLYYVCLKNNIILEKKFGYLFFTKEEDIERAKKYF